MAREPENHIVKKIPTGIPGFDTVAEGGVPEGRSTLVGGTSGAGKTVFGAQFIAEGIDKHDANGVFVTFEETPEDIRSNVFSLGWDIQQWEDDGKWRFVDAAVRSGEDTVFGGTFDLGALLARIEHAVRSINASRVTLDSLGAIFSQFTDQTLVRREFFRIASALKAMGVTTLMTGERIKEYGEISRHHVEEFVSDNVILLRNALEGERRRRTVEVLKFRGAYHQKGEYPFTILPGKGIMVIPLSAMELTQRSTDVRTTSGNKVLDSMCGGGMFRDSITLVSGATGTGKTLLTTGFLAGGVQANERCLAFCFEESHDQFYRNAKNWGYDLAELEEHGILRVVSDYPETMGLEDHLVNMKTIIEEFKPDRIAVDSLSALERVGTEKGFREFIIALTSFIKTRQVLGLFTNNTATLTGGSTVTESHISTLTDSIILLRYVEMFGEMHRGLAVLKMRGSMHEKEIREFNIDGQGMHIGKPFKDVVGILGGIPQHVRNNELDDLKRMFADPAAHR